MSPLENDLQRTYRLWFEHARRCEECRHVAKAPEGCESGRELWRVYRMARIGGGA
jgi:hypothetical protein